MPEQQFQEPPTAQVIDMLQQNYSIDKIRSSLQSLGYSQEIISEAINQAHVKATIEETVPPAPSPMMQQSILRNEGEPQRPTFQQKTPQATTEFLPSRDSQEQIEELVEAVIEEKWRRVLEDIGNLSAWRERVRNDVLALKQEMLRLETRFENLITAVTGKVKEYDKGMENIGTDVKALEKLLQQIITPLSTNVKELSRITETLKKSGKK